MTQNPTDKPSFWLRLRHKIGDDFQLRIGSACVLGAVSLLCVSLGGISFALLVAIAAAIALWEWRRVTLAPLKMGKEWPLLLVFGLCIACSVFLGLLWSLILIAVMALGISIWDSKAKRQLRWSVSGIALIGLAALCIIWLRDPAQIGFMGLLWLILIVIATDVGGYVGGRLIGGPKLAPRISPKKTISGFVTASLLGMLTSALFVAYSPASIGRMLLIGVMISIIAQIGDLSISAVKRQFGVKDYSQVIPGHGGILDRADGLIAAIIFLCLLMACGVRIII